VPHDPKSPTAEELWGMAVSSPEIPAYLEALTALGPSSMTAGQLDGLMAAVLTAPNPPGAEEWLAAIWVLEEDDPEPDIDPEDPAVAGAFALILDRLSEITADLDSGIYEPLFDGGDDGSVVWETWADGFMVGMTLDVDGWEQRLQSSSAAGEAAQLMMTLIDVSRDDPETLKRLGRKTVEHFRLHAPDLLTECVLEMWRPPTPQRPTVRGPKIGRNDPCPCGSGKKHKKCCGAG